MTSRMAIRRSLSIPASLLAITLLQCGNGNHRAYVEPHTGMRFALIPPGEFGMGSFPTEPGHRPDETYHRVVISKAFYMGATEVTRQQWTAVMGYNPSQFRGGGPSLPVETVSWLEVQEFLRRLNHRNEGHFRLPTEAEWEYACRAGSTTPYAFGERLTTRQANFDDRDNPRAAAGDPPYRGSPIPVASFQPNEWGLYDMHGNVWEWCADEVCPYPTSAVTDPQQKCGSRFKPIRGGSWYFGADSARCALRYTHEPQLSGFSIGFRIVRDP